MPEYGSEATRQLAEIPDELRAHILANRASWDEGRRVVLRLPDWLVANVEEMAADDFDPRTCRRWTVLYRLREEAALVRGGASSALTADD
jgi:hypothetical protein